VTESGELPEAWCANTAHHDYYNSPLCWSHALHVVASEELERRKAKTPTLGADPAAAADLRGA
jgi:hypothetical protein